MLIAPLVWVVLAQVPTSVLTGTVVDPAGEAVVGADLVLVGLPSFAAPIVAQGKTGEGGRFSLDRPTALAGDHHPQRAPILWVVKPGFRLSATRFPEALPRPGEPVRVVLEPPGSAEVRVEGPDGRPLSGVKVLPERLKTHYTVVPDVVAELVSRTTGPDGLAVIDAVSQDELAYVDIHSREFGIQGKFIIPRPGKPAEIAMRPASTWKGRLSAEDPRHARGWKVRAWSRTGGDPTEPATTGYVETTTDDEGRFVLAPIAVGGLQLDLKPPGDLPVVPDLPWTLSVREGREDSAEIPLRRTVTVTGLFLERGTGKPVPGISATLIPLGGSRNKSQTVQTDERGRYTFQSLPGLVRVGHFRFPPTHVEAPTQGWEDFTVPEPPNVVELATRDALPAAPPLRGQVVDEAGRGVPGATVQLSWMLTGSKGSSSGNIRTTADEQGNFAQEGLGPDSTVTITARFRDRRSKQPLTVRAGEKSPVTVAIVPTPVLAVAGRVLGPGGAPLAAIPIKVQFRVAQDNFPGIARPVQLEGNPTITTADDGTFRTPKELERKPSEYRLEVSTAGYLPARTPWIPAPESDLLTLPDLTLKRSRRVRIVSGRVVDRDGKPVPGASVSQMGDGPMRTSVKADADGRFRLAGVPGGKALVAAEAPGFRFGGAIVGGVADAVEIRLARTGEPPIATLKSLPSPLSRTDERALGRALLEPLLPLARDGSLGSSGAAVIAALARLDPARVLDMIENRAIADLTGALIQVALGQFEDDPAAALATIGDDRDPGARAAGWLALEDFRPAPDRARREDLLERALADARKAVVPGQKLGLLGQVADRWLALGAVERASPILREGQAIVAAWPRQDWFAEAEDFANVLAVIDLPAAVALFERRGKTNVSPTDDTTINAHKGQAAIRLARQDPAEAERLVAPPSSTFYDRTRIVLNVARAMAKTDLPRARRLVETLDDEPSPGSGTNPALVPLGLGWIAAGLAESTPAQARSVLDEAFAGLRAIAVDGRSEQGQVSVANFMAELLPIVERLEPDRLAERTWMVAASRPPSFAEPPLQQVVGICTLAMLVARYDRAIADAIIGPALERLPDLLVDSLGSFSNGTPTIFHSLTAYDPRAILPLIQALPEPARRPPPARSGWTAPSVEAQLRLAAAQVLGHPVEDRTREAGRIGSQARPYRPGD